MEITHAEQQNNNHMKRKGVDLINKEKKIPHTSDYISKGFCISLTLTLDVEQNKCLSIKHKPVNEVHLLCCEVCSSFFRLIN